MKRKQQPHEAPATFKDYCLILQLHPEADGGMVEAAYWHLAKRYSEAGSSDPSAKARLDDLNEAYGVLGSPKHREDYMKLRAEVLGEGALPAPPKPPPEPVPLAVMAKQRARIVEEPAVLAGRDQPFWARTGVFKWQNAVAVLVMGALATAALSAGVHPAAVGLLLLIGVAITAMPTLGSMLLTQRGNQQRLRLANLKISPPPDPVPQPIARAIDSSDERKAA
ncbi:MAG: hypothetical protein WD939_05010 [Dehalococcoidia bacterium]